MYYAAVNSYATAASIGFFNTWSCIGFATRQMRDAYVARATDLATKSIKSSEIRTYGGKPGQVNYYNAGGDLQLWTPNGYMYGGHEIDPTTAAPRQSSFDRAVEKYWDSVA